jgi:hypothetical protein
MQFQNPRTTFQTTDFTDIFAISEMNAAVISDEFLSSVQSVTSAQLKRHKLDQLPWQNFDSATRLSLTS